MTLTVRESNETDIPAILDLMVDAFGQQEGSEIAGLITDLLADDSAKPRLSLVAVTAEKVIGYILFTRAAVDCSGRTFSASILAPLAVHPDYQSQGIGGRLITAGLAQIKNLPVQLVFVLGYPAY